MTYKDVLVSYFLFQIKAEEKKKELKKYTVKPPKDLQSKFEKKQAAKAKAEREAEEAKRKAEEEERQAVSYCHIVDKTLYDEVGKKKKGKTSQERVYLLLYLTK